jgi:hypothetical protein
MSNGQPSALLASTIAFFTGEGNATRPYASSGEFFDRLKMRGARPAIRKQKPRAKTRGFVWFAVWRARYQNL